MRIGILTVSDRCSQQKMSDDSGAFARSFFAGKEKVIRHKVVPDERKEIVNALLEMSDKLHLDLIVTIGGTGLGPRDVTPEATASVIDRTVPGIPEYLRRETQILNPHVVISRAIAGLRGKTLIVNLPGNPKAVLEQLALLSPLLLHIQDMLDGKNHERKSSLAHS
ncbi:MAG: MogA/MoaB family molybdenum cofactor biosynthesis protein [Candidatus Omnitrophica bacterium]|nr:MogA/MoaB family molybdenum cofactor biosynthesis protein [Candidatus Omnitrophota bacterium]